MDPVIWGGGHRRCAEKIRRVSHRSLAVAIARHAEENSASNRLLSDQAASLISFLTGKNLVSHLPERRQVRIRERDDFPLAVSITDFGLKSPARDRLTAIVCAQCALAGMGA